MTTNVPLSGPLPASRLQPPAPRYPAPMHHLHLVQTIGKTPMVELRRLSPNPDVRIFAKLEGWNPTGSIKDRIVRHMIQHAERDGRIVPGDTVIEASTGNTGIALAMIGRALGYNVRVVMPENVYPEIPRTLAVYGAEVHWVPAADGVTGVRRLLENRDAPAATGAHPLTRRDFARLLATAIPALTTVGAAAIALWQIERFRIRRLTVALPDLPAALDGLTIAHVTDFHVGQFTRSAVLDRIVAATNDLRADLILFTGDLINFALSDLDAGLTALRRLRATHGVFLCEGNHDLFEDAAAFRRRTRAAGLRLLVNETASITIRGVALQILGLRWGAAGHHAHDPASRGDAAIAGSMRALLAQLQPGAFPILLAHHPHAFDFAENIPLTLAGHTHGGQLMVTPVIGFGPMLYRYWSGLYRQGQRALIVSNGTGNWFPLRTRAPAEIIHLTLRRGDGPSGSASV